MREHATISFILQAKAAYAAFLQLVRDSYNCDKVADGEFGAMMDVSLVNDGPVTCSSHLFQHTDPRTEVHMHAPVEALSLRFLACSY